MSKQKNISLTNSLLYVLAGFILWILFKILELKIQYKPIFEWWNGNGGKKYNVSLFNIVAAYNNRIIYEISKFQGSIVNKLTTSQIMFFSDLVFPNTLYVDAKGVQHNYLLPYHVAENAMLKPGQNLVFDTWYKINEMDITVDLKYDGNGVPTNKGVYPNPLSTSDWKDKMVDWGVVWSTKPNESNLIVPDLKATKLKEWFDQSVTGHPDNFLAWVGIAPDSPLVIFFVNGKYNDPNTGLKLDPQAFRNLTGQGSHANLGGWLGFILGMGPSTSQDEYENTLFTSYAVKDVPPRTSPACTPGSTSNVLGDVSSGLGSIASMGMMGAMFGPIGIGIGVLAGAVVGGLSIASKSTSKKC